MLAPDLGQHTFELAGMLRLMHNKLMTLVAGDGYPRMERVLADEMPPSVLDHRHRAATNYACRSKIAMSLRAMTELRRPTTFWKMSYHRRALSVGGVASLKAIARKS